MFGRAKNELDKPPLAKEDGTVEILRVWGGRNLPQQYSLLPTWDDPAAWGMLLVDIARHAAKAYSSTGSQGPTHHSSGPARKAAQSAQFKRVCRAWHESSRVKVPVPGL